MHPFDTQLHRYSYERAVELGEPASDGRLS